MTPNDEYRTLLTILEHLNTLRVHLNPPITGEDYAQALQKLQADHRERLDTAYQIQFITLDYQHGKRVTLLASDFQRWDPYECHVVRIDDDETGDMHLIAIHPERLDMVDWGGVRGEAVNKAILGLPKAVGAMVLASYDKWYTAWTDSSKAGDTAQGDLWNPALEASIAAASQPWHNSVDQQLEAATTWADGTPVTNGLNGHITEKGWYPDPDKCNAAISNDRQCPYDFSKGREAFQQAWADEPEALAEIMHHFDAWEAKHYTPSTS